MLDFNTNNSNEILKIGIGILIIGIVLVFYCISTSIEMKQLEKVADFELIDNNQDLSSSDKYYKYLEISDFLNKKLERNKNLPVKNVTCNYIEYGYHNTMEMYNLSRQKLIGENDKINVVSGIVKHLNEILPNYSTCSKYEEYKKQIEKTVSDIDTLESKQAESSQRMLEFMNEPSANIESLEQTKQEHLSEEVMNEHSSNELSTTHETEL